jgi:hypothetical protein
MDTSNTDLTTEDSLGAEWSALLKHDLEIRDKLCAMAKRTFKDQQQISCNTPVSLGRDGAQ